MTAFCLPPALANALIKALSTLDPGTLSDMTSAERRAMFEPIVGAENAEDVNALFESKLLLVDKKKGLEDWANKLVGISEPRRQDILSKISKMTDILNPTEERRFLADLAAQKLGATVTSEEAKAIFDLSKVAETAKAKMVAEGWTPENGTAYGLSVMDLKDKVESLKPQGHTFSENLLDSMAVPKTLLTSVFHFSALGVQLWGSITNPRTWEGFAQQFKYFADEQNYRNLQAYMIGHPDYNLAVGGRLGITKLGDQLTMREEAIQSSLVEKANQYLTDKTGVPNLVRASSRAFSGYLNFVRFHSFTDLLTAARLNNEDVRMGSSVVSDLANVVNNFTGRGSLGRLDDSKAVAALNATFFAPRKVAATIQMFNPVNYLNPAISPTARSAATRNLAGSLVATGAVLGVARAMGADVDVDPRSSDFLKIQIGEEKLDITGGNGIYLRLLARIASNQEVTSKGKMIELGQGYKPATRADLVLAYTRGKLSPVASLLADALYGSDPVGRPFSVTQEAQDKLVPIVMNNFIKFAYNDPTNAAAMIPSLATIFGVGLESPLPGISLRDTWGELPANHVQNDPVDASLHHLGIYPPNASKKIRGITLSDKQEDEYQQLRGRIMKGMLTAVLQTPNFNSLPQGVQEETLTKRINIATETANIKMMKRYPGIAVEANKAKRDALKFGTPAAIARRTQ